MAELPTVTTSQPHLAKQDLKGLDISKLTPLSPEVISRQATINIGETVLEKAPIPVIDNFGPGA